RLLRPQAARSDGNHHRPLTRLRLVQAGEQARSRRDHKGGVMRFKVSTHAAIAAALLFGVGIASAQEAQKSTTTETKKFTVLAVDGNVLDVRLPEGTREINVPDDFRFTVDGKQMSVHELKPGMSGTATITTTTTVTPVTVTEVRNGVVQRVMGSTI